MAETAASGARPNDDRAARLPPDRQAPAAGRRPLIAGNWKLWGTRGQVETYAKQLLSLLPDAAARPADVALCVPFTALDTAVQALDGSGVLVAAQNMHAAAEGAFTGEVSAPMLTEAGARGVVLGHSERRELFGETDRALQDKVPVALDAGLMPMLCVGETEEEREAGDMERKLRYQVGEGLEGVPDERLAEVVVAYEPIWAIGSGQVATTDQAQEAVAFVRALIASRSTEAAERVRVIYGGSVKPDNAAEILSQPDVDGALVGGASLDPEGFAQIAAAAG
ncbi:MAG: triose-phosphate isomerase [Thermoleophilaceae bacterium]